MEAPKQRYRIDLSYHGAEFHGWQKQPGLRTVQGELEDWLGRLLAGGSPISVTGAGRTDAGVHAGIMTAHFDTIGAVNDTADLAHRLRGALPPDITVRRILAVDDTFHARFSALSKTYQYQLTTEPSPFNRDRVWHFRGDFDCERANQAAAVIAGEHDFAGFCRVISQKENMNCTVRLSEWSAGGDTYSYRIRANRFLHEMVRLLVGTMADVARGRWDANQMALILEKQDVRLCGMAAPPHGLALVDIEYPDGVVASGDFS